MTSYSNTTTLYTDSTWVSFLWHSRVVLHFVSTAVVMWDLTFDQYYELLKSTCMLYDTNNKGMKRSGSSMDPRHVYQLESYPADSFDQDDDDGSDAFYTDANLHQLPVYADKQYCPPSPDRHPDRPCLDRETWRCLSDEDKVAWDHLLDAAKQSTLSNGSSSTAPHERIRQSRWVIWRPRTAR